MSALTLVAPQRAEADGPFIFLAGPIQGADDWQSEAIELIHGMSDAVHVASPRRSGTRAGEFTEEMYHEQVDWEHDFLSRTMEHGVVLFWLAREAEHDCDRAYAQTTRFELGEAATLHRVLGANVVVGFEEGFTNARYLRRTIAKKMPDIPQFDSLDATCRAAVDMAIASRPNVKFVSGLGVC